MWPSAFVAALFALHPLRVESVAWVSERKDVLSTFFWLWTMLAYVYYTRGPGFFRYIMVMLCFALGLMSKPMLVTLPAVLMLMDYWPLKRFEPNEGVSRIGLLVAEKIPLFLMTVGSAAMTMYVQRKAMPALEIMDLPMRVTNAIVSFWRYIGMMIWPRGLAAFYPHKHAPLYLGAAIVSILLVIATIAVVRMGRKYKYLVFGWFWYIVTLLPVIGLVQVGDQSHADRYTYVPLIGLCVIIAWAASEIVDKRRNLHGLAAAAAVLILMTCSALTWRQAGFWKDDAALFKRCVDATEGNYVMLSNLGVTYNHLGELDRAMDVFQKSLDIRPLEGRTLNGMGTVLLKKQQPTEALKYFLKAVEYQPDLKEPQLSAARTLMNLGRFAEAEPYCRKAIELDPYWANAYANLGTILGETGRFDEGMAACRKAMELDPKLAMAHFNMAGIYVKQEDFETAAREYRNAIAIEGDFSAWNNLGNSLLRLGRLEEAEQCYRQSIKLNPMRPDACYNMGIALAGLGRIPEAIEAVQRAVALSPESRDMQDYLAALHQQLEAQR
jgi:tetratricopeptide (TPR) repeat protein